MVSGGLVELGDLLLAPLRDAFGAHLEGAPYRPEVPIVPAALGAARRGRRRGRPRRALT